MELPKNKIKSNRLDPRSIVIYSQPKTGKSTIVSELNDCLILDLEKSTEFLDAVKIDVLQEAKEQGKLPIIVLKKIINQIKEENEAKNGYVYKYIAIDTVSALETLVLPLANKMYKNTPQGRNWVGDDVTTLGNGAGFRWTRLALFTIINEIEELCDTLIILGHVKDKLVEVSGEEMTERGLDLIGKSSSILCSKVDAIGYLYRHENETILNFKPSESLIVGGRSEHLVNKKIVVASSDDNDKVTVDWSKVFLD